MRVGVVWKYLSLSQLLVKNGVGKGRKLAFNLLGTRHYASFNAFSLSKTRGKQCGVMVKNLTSGAKLAWVQNPDLPFFVCDLEQITWCLNLFFFFDTSFW